MTMGEKVEGVTHQVQSTSDKMVLDTGAILRTTTTDQDNRMLLYIVTCEARVSHDVFQFSCSSPTRNLCSILLLLAAKDNAPSPGI